VSAKKTSLHKSSSTLIPIINGKYFDELACPLLTKLINVYYYSFQLFIMNLYINQSHEFSWVAVARPYWLWIPDVVSIRPTLFNLRLVDQANRVFNNELALFGFAERFLVGSANYYVVRRGI